MICDRKESELLDIVSSYIKSDKDIAFIKKACEFSKEAHKHQKRASGDLYYLHPLEVAIILSKYKLDFSTVAGALLHDTVEDTGVTLEDINENFGSDVTKLVDGVTKLTKIKYQSENKRQAENFRKFLVAISEDIRILLIKLVDRLHNMRTISSIESEEKRKKISYETMEIYAPLAERIGMQSLKSELQELSFEVLHPEERRAISNRLNYLKGKDKKNILQKIIKDLEDLLFNDIYNLKGSIYKISGRKKTLFSIWKKMKQKNVGFERLSDIVAFRIMTVDVFTCYKVLGIIHTNYKMLPNSFSDFISTPKNNGYQSLHTVVMYSDIGCVEIQINTKEMDEVAEKGVAAHWAYKQSYEYDVEAGKYSWIRELLSILENTNNYEEFLEYTKLQMYYNQVFCFTPKGKVIALPKGAMPLDFAYSVGLDTGNKFSGVKINGKLASIGTNLLNGDQVEIITSEKALPSPYWNDFAITGKAMSEIKKYISTQEKKKYVKLGKEILSKTSKEKGFNLDKHNINKLLKVFDKKNKKDLYLHIAQNKLTSENLSEIILQDKTKADIENVVNNFEIRDDFLNADTSNLVKLKDKSDIKTISFSRCCCPVPGDLIFGLNTPDDVIEIHCSDCCIFSKNTENKSLTETEWNQELNDNRVSVVVIKISLVNKIGSLSALTNVIARKNSNINNFKVIKYYKHHFDILLEITVFDKFHLGEILTLAESLSEVLSAERYKAKL